MALTPNRTTIKAAIDALIATLRTNLVADPTTVTAPFRSLTVGDVDVTSFPRPFLLIAMKQARPVGTTNDDKLMEVTVTFRIVTDVSASEPHGVLLDQIGAVDDHLDSLIDVGVIDGADGLDDRVWTFEYPRTTSGSRVAVASASQTMMVAVERLQNRAPAP